MNKAAFLVPSILVKGWLWISERLQNRLKNSDFFLCVAYGPRDGGALWDRRAAGGVPMGNTSVSRLLIWDTMVQSRQAEDQRTPE